MSTGDVRIAWMGQNMSYGHGTWYPSKDRPMLEDHMEEMKKKYPEVRHWIDEMCEDGTSRPSPSIVR
jgi:hypothetical protein